MIYQIDVVVREVDREGSEKIVTKIAIYETPNRELADKLAARMAVAVTSLRMALESVPARTPLPQKEEELT